ncbi:non-specific lipid-transfer protein 2 [Tripterygium wilfordii]|uniref:Non-specific lipid-transfer protein 2 n=1 Tax=Tripterygium wilfordii TaxID=458696 RepID=A0A7J7DV49_TRIWF|nr:non-specific lipid-transfer protein 2-like [Tripterygium wilfordii]KAF5750169.1 non-specific lipid-transfer protein 2 [Tripterygium wilfordii]
MKKVSSHNVVSLGLLMVVIMLATQINVSQAVTCNPSELSSCAPAIASGAAPSSTCCSKVREQRPCLCGYLKNPNLRQFVNSPNARKVSRSCGVPFPNC